MNTLHVQDLDGEGWRPRGKVTWLRLPVTGYGTPKAGVDTTNAFVAGGKRRPVRFEFFADDGYSYTVEAIASKPSPTHNDVIDLHEAVISKVIRPTRDQ